MDSIQNQSFSLVKLSKDVQRRIRFLATPKQAYKLQVAVGNEENHLGPTQFGLANPWFPHHSFVRENEKLVLKEFALTPYGVINQVVRMEKDTLIVINHEFDPSIMVETDVTDPIFDHIILEPYSINLENGFFTAKMLQKIATKSCRILKFNGHFLSYGVDLLTVLQSFPCCQKIKIGNLRYENWAQTFIEAGIVDMLNLWLYGDPGYIYSCTPLEVYMLCRAQQNDFKLELNVFTKTDVYFTVFHQSIGDFFVETNENDEDIVLTVVQVQFKVYYKFKVDEMDSDDTGEEDE
uniref:FBA_2 domain-containing protein n=1 Tax=Panagrellus redivivus TaxID=6233 RepID=A0A7E4VZM2_PANRE